MVMDGFRVGLVFMVDFRWLEVDDIVKDKCSGS